LTRISWVESPGTPISRLAACEDAIQENGVPGQGNNLFNRIYPLFEFVFATGLPQA